MKLHDLMIIAGVSALTYGVSLWSVPAAFVTAGAMATGLGLAAAAAHARANRKG